MPTYCEDHGMYHSDALECWAMRRDDRAAAAEEVATREKAERIADAQMETLAAAFSPFDTLADAAQTIRGLIESAALAALTDKENAR